MPTWLPAKSMPTSGASAIGGSFTITRWWATRWPQQENLAGYRFPDPALPARWQVLEALLARYGCSHCIAADMSSNLFEIGFHLRGMERWLTDLVSDSALVEELLERLLSFDLAVARLAAQRGVDIIWLGSDIASQQQHDPLARALAAAVQAAYGAVDRGNQGRVPADARCLS